MLDILFGGGKQFDDYPLFQPENCTSIEDCLKIEIVMEKILGMDYFWEGFGTFLRNYVLLNEFDSFKIDETFMNIYYDKVAYGDMSSICENLRDDEIKTHQIFTELSKLIGFEDNEVMSLYDIPGMISDVARKDFDEVIYGAMYKSSFYSRCKYGFDYEDLSKCGRAWGSYVDEIRNNNMSGKMFKSILT